VTIVGNVIHIEGCIPSGGFATPSIFTVDVTVAPLSAGAYDVQYYRTLCGQYAPPPELRTSRPLAVRVASPSEPSIPTPPSEVFHYWHRQFDHYFITADNWEKLGLETGRFWGWDRTSPFLGTPPALRFGMYREIGQDRTVVCRFFSDRFAPKSSHFYAVGDAECDAVKLNRDWTYEGIVGYVYERLSDGSCDRGVPLYRLYNNGQGGAPNHRYTTSWVVRAEMLGRGWIPEGDGIGVIACVPKMDP
jgi:hypothetical protein